MIDMKHLKKFEQKDQYGDVMYIRRDDWPLTADNLKEVLKEMFLVIASTVPQKHFDKIKFFSQPPPEVEVYSLKDPEAAKMFNCGFVAWRYSP